MSGVLPWSFIATVDPGTVVQNQGCYLRIAFRCHQDNNRVSIVAFTRNQEVR